MPLSVRIGLSLRVVGLATLLSAARIAPARAESATKSACIADFERAEELRATRKLVDARNRLLACASDRCPDDVQKECIKDLVLVEQSLSTIVLVARDEEGHDMLGAHASVDGDPRALDGQALSLDPGRHAIRFEMAGCAPAEPPVLLAEGEKNRTIVGTLRCMKDHGRVAPASVRSWGGPLPFVLAGAGAVGLIGFTYFGLRGRSDIDDIRATGCAPSCDHDAVMHARTKLLVADVLGGIGLVGLGTAAWLFLSGAPSAAPRRDPTLDVRPAANGGALVVRGHL